MEPFLGRGLARGLYRPPPPQVGSLPTPWAWAWAGTCARLSGMDRGTGTGIEDSCLP